MAIKASIKSCSYLFVGIFALAGSAQAETENPFEVRLPEFSFYKVESLNNSIPDSQLVQFALTNETNDSTVRSETITQAPQQAPIVVGASFFRLSEAGKVLTGEQVPVMQVVTADKSQDILSAAKKAEGSVLVEPVRGAWPIDNAHQALHLAVRRGEIRTINKLLDSGVPIDARDIDGKTALFIAIESYHPQVVTHLLKMRADSLVTTGKGWTLLHHAAYYGQAGVMEELLASGVDPTTQDHAGWTALHVAAFYGFIPVVQVLLREQEIALNAKNNDGYTALAITSAKGYLPIVNMLARRKDLNLNLTDDRGRTALHLAARKGITSVAQILILRGANTTVLDENGRTAIELAKAAGYRKTANEMTRVMTSSR